ncbi:MAG: hypothetical protein ACRBK7_15760 [Acidimicrobiales bacterium]
MAGHTGDLPTVLDGLNHEAAEVRVVALGAAQRLDALSVEMLTEALSDPSELVRYRAVELVARASFGQELAPALVAALADPELSEVAAFALGELELSGESKQQAVAALGHQATSDEDALCRESAVAALGALEDGLSFVLSATSDVATVRRRAVLALAPFDGPEVDAALQKALSDRDWQVRQAAEDLLA